ncbi:hypothetical protein MAE02_59280 [Microvirga aerophila]|uniref:Uncharacterized protein n=1 Tax=Microvirga aerophila TaxID=670291 RepID=A0A512C1Z1_9HYPH|nr:hypothetical protein MAE02_59280 [Microvirga aerophila]
MGLAWTADAVDLTIVQRDDDGTFRSLSITLAQLLAALEWRRRLTREIAERLSRGQALSSADRPNGTRVSDMPGGEI